VGRRPFAAKSHASVLPVGYLRVQPLCTRNAASYVFPRANPIADSSPAGKDFYPERPSRVKDLSSNPKKDFNPAFPEPRRAEHPDERTASSAYGVYPDPVEVSLRLVFLRLTTDNRARRRAAKKDLAGKR